MLIQTRHAAALILAGALSAPGFQTDKHGSEDAQCLKRRAQAYQRSRYYPVQGKACSMRMEAIRRTELMIGLAAPGTWKFLGPRPTVVLSDNLSGGPPIASGRVTSVAIDPRNPDVVYLGAAHGGVWKSVDAGRNWQPLTDNQVSLAIGSLALDPSNPSIVYAGTGEENFSLDSAFGVGILKSDDAGRSWRLLTSWPGASSAVFAGAQIGALAVHPGDGRILLAAVNNIFPQQSGIYRSPDGGVTWQLVLGGAPGSAVVFNPKDPRIVYAGLGGVDANEANGIYRSSDAGLNWKRIVTGIPEQGVGRVSLAIAASKPEVLYAAIANPESNEPLGVFRTDNGGDLWTTDATPGYCFGTCWYANSIAVDPGNPDVALVGGLELHMTRDGGKTWLNVSQGANGNAIHWDIHSLVFGPGGGRLFIGTDGGIYRGTNVGPHRIHDIGWDNLNETLAITQFHSGCSAHPDGVDFIICGTQDNGTQIFTGGSHWRMVAGGDGGFTALDSARPSVFYYSFAGMVNVNKSSPFTLYKGFLGINTGLENVNTDDCYLPPLALDPANPQRLYMGCSKIYRTDDGGGLWTEVSSRLNRRPGAGDGDGTPVYTYIAVAPASSARVYAAVSDGRLHVSSNASSAAGASWENRIAGLPGRPVSWVAVDSADPDTAVVTLHGFSGRPGDKQGHVFRTANAGRTWVDISGNLPNIPAHTVIFDPGSTKTLYVGTDIGVFRTMDGGVSWAPMGQGLPRCPVVDLKLHAGARLLRAATYGRGMWELKLPRLRQTGKPPMRIESAALEPQSAVAAAQRRVTLHGSGFEAKTVVRWNGEDRPTRFLDAQNMEIDVSSSDAAAAQLTSLSARRPDGGLSNVINLETGGPPSIARVANGAGGPPEKVPNLAPGALATVFGENLAPRTVTVPPETAGKTLAGAVVEFRSVVTHLSYPARLLFVSPTRIDFQVPHDLPQKATVRLDVVQGTRMSNRVDVNISKFSPGLFSANGQGSGQGKIFCDSDGKLAAPAGDKARPAKPGEIVRLLATGLGPHDTDDDKNPQPTIAAVQVFIGGLPAKVIESVALTPLVGEYQVKAEVPAGLPSGPAVVVSLEAGGVRSNSVTIAVE